MVSNAAIGVLRPALEMTIKHWRRCMETNALALNTLAQQAVPLMTRDEFKALMERAKHGAATYTAPGR